MEHTNESETFDKQISGQHLDSQKAFKEGATCLYLRGVRRSLLAGIYFEGEPIRGWVTK
jgi:hypothetical protein